MLRYQTISDDRNCFSRSLHAGRVCYSICRTITTDVKNAPTWKSEVRTQNSELLTLNPDVSPFQPMTTLGQVAVAVDNYRKMGVQEVQRVRGNREYGEQLVKKWRETRANIGHATTPTGLRLPRLALPDVDDPGEIARFLWDEGL